MDVLRGQSPDIVRKEIYMHLLAYNLIRVLMWQAAATHRQSLHRLSYAEISCLNYYAHFELFRGNFLWVLCGLCGLLKICANLRLRQGRCATFSATGTN